jgi:N-acetylmuramic acid 6-phosphate etherase
MNAQDQIPINAVAAEQANIAKAITLVVQAFRNNGRLIYFGAGTSGRLGVLDASECPPTFRCDPEMVQGVIAGGPAAMFRAQEGAEDRAEDGATAVDEKKMSKNDVAMGIAAGGTTPFVHGALHRARELGASTIFLTCVQPFPSEPVADCIIRPLTGPEILTGSTRLKAATATKLVLNTITTLAMVQMGKVYENLMVDLRATNQKLHDRATRIVSSLTGLSKQAAINLLQQADGHVKVAVLMHARRLDMKAARELLARHQDHLRDSLDS